MNKKSLLVLGIALLVGVVAARVFISYRDAQPLYVTGTGAAPPMKGGPENAEHRARELLKIYKDTDGHLLENVSLEELQLPDQASAEIEQNRASNTTAWAVPIDKPFSNVAFYTDLYAKRNHSYYKGSRMTAQPTGFFIVAYKTGEIKRIPVSDLRIMPYQNAQILVFPGVEGYKSSLPHPAGFIEEQAK